MLFLNKALSKLIPSFRSVDEWMVIYEELLHMKDIKDITREAAAEIASEADAEIQRLREGFARLRDAGDLEMGDGDLARQIASEMLAP